MVIQNTPTKIDKIASLRIGQRGENLATDIKMDVSDWITVHPDANYYCLFKRPDEVQVQPVLSSLEEDVLTWTVRAWECAVIGVGYLEVRAVNPDTGLVAKSRVIPCAIEDSVIDDEGPVPPEMSWVGEVLAAKDTAVAAKTAAEEARDTAQTTVNGAIAGIQAEGQTQVGVVQAEGTTQVGAVQSEGTTQVGAVQSEGTTQVGAVQAKGTEVLNSIPADYTALSDDVTDLKSAIDEALGDFESNTEQEITNLTRYTGKRYGDDGTLIDNTPSIGTSEAVEIPVTPGDVIRWVCYYANRNASYNIKYMLSSSEVIADTNYTTSGDEYTFTVPTNCVKVLASCWVIDGNHFYKLTNEYQSVKNYIDGEITTLENATGAKIAETKSDLQESIDSISNAVLDLKSLSGEIITINDSALDYCKSIDTEANALYRCGVNIWNEEWELGSYASDGTPSSSATTIRSKNDSPIPIKPSTEYYIITPYNVSVLYYRSDETFISYEVVNASSRVFTTPNNAYFLRYRCVDNYGTTYNNDIQIALNSDPDKATYHAHTTQQVSDVSALKIVPNARNYIYAVASDDSVAVEYYVTKTWSGGKKPYESGFIIFSVPSRLTKSNNSVGASVVSEGTDDSQDVNCILKLPATYTPTGKPTKLIMICHGAGQSAQQWSTNASYIALTDAFINAGYAIFDCNGYRENALGYSFWGDSRGVDVWRKAYQYVVDNYNVEQTFGLYGFSMGGLTALNLMMSGFPGIKCVALGSPVVNLEACYNSESVSAVIKTLYGMGDTYDPSKAYGCNPYARIVTIDNTKYIFGAFPPIKLWYGSTETGTTDTGAGEVVTGVVVKAYGNDIVKAINNAGGQAEYREIEGAGHEICYGGNSTVNADLVLYFNRHNKIS